MPHPFVRNATIKDKVIALTVELEYAYGGSYVEISGSATQTSGAYANFYAVGEATAGSAVSGEYPTVNVSATCLPPKYFRKDEDVTFVIRVATVWLTVLGPHGSEPPPVPGTTPEITPDDGSKTWDVLKQESHIVGSDVQDGQSGTDGTHTTDGAGDTGGAGATQTAPAGP